MLRRIALLASAAPIMLTLVATPASAAPVPRGALCGFASVSNPQLPGQQLAVVVGGPVTLTDDANPAIVYSGTLTCTLQVNDSTHAGGDACARSGPTTSGIAAVPPQACTFAATSQDHVFVCTQLDLLGGPTLYYDNNLVWSTDPGADCEHATAYSCVGNLHGLCDPKGNVLDPIICPLLQPFFPPEGDVGIFWDCPPYGSPRPDDVVPVHGFFEQPGIDR